MASMNITERLRIIGAGRHMDLANIVCEAAIDEIDELKLERDILLDSLRTIVQRHQEGCEARILASIALNALGGEHERKD